MELLAIVGQRSVFVGGVKPAVMTVECLWRLTPDSKGRSTLLMRKAKSRVNKLAEGSTIEFFSEWRKKSGLGLAALR